MSLFDRVTSARVEEAYWSVPMTGSGVKGTRARRRHIILAAPTQRDAERAAYRDYKHLGGVDTGGIREVSKQEFARFRKSQS